MPILVYLLIMSLSVNLEPLFQCWSSDGVFHFFFFILLLIANFILTFFLLIAYASEVFVRIPLMQIGVAFKPQEYIFMILSPIAYGKGFDRIFKQRDYSGAISAILLVLIDFILYASIDFLLEYLSPYGNFSPCEKLNPSETFRKPEKNNKEECETTFIDILPTNADSDPYI
ncbi:hypothetical protein NPIL_319251, partial [Nephila pilipes]